MVFASCGDQKRDLITRKWQAISLENETLDKDMAEKQQFMDTVGQHTTPEMNMALYGVPNTDTIKTILRAQMDEAKMVQQYTLEHTIFEFRPDKVAVLSFGSNPDSANWYFDDEGALILDDMAMKGAGDKTKMDIVTLNDTLLKLKYTEDGITSTATFKPMKK
ncbi:hypothetical protein DN068_20085 [Taibaiella soli]|uniref:Lipocalin-like domain-containing protein n=1 Tax=Taibaiella soli TaxID=1649169 RepID=A0A2W2A6T3_9BACT|nr:hypothetical protein DN068_20085 [Taibaiella soli]